MLANQIEVPDRKIRASKLRHQDIQESNEPINVLEAEARTRQEKILVEEVTKDPNTNLEVWAGHSDDESRRLSHDVFSTFKRSFLECMRYAATMDEVKVNKAELKLLHELIKNWITISNFEHIATLLNFSTTDVEILIAELEHGKGIKADQYIDEHQLDKSAPWYKDVLSAIAVDDIVPLVMMRELILQNIVEVNSAVPWFKSILANLVKNDLTPSSVKKYITQNFETVRSPNQRVRPVSLRQLFVGLQNYIERETLAIVDSGDEQAIVAQKLTALSEERRKLSDVLRGMKRERETKF